MVWIEFMTTIDASLARSRLAMMSRTLIEAASSIGRRRAEPAGAQADLLDGFLAGDVEHAFAGAGEAGRGLQQQGGFADTGIAADQDRRGGNEAAAEHAVEFLDAGGGAGGGAVSPRRPDEVHAAPTGAFGRGPGGG